MTSNVRVVLDTSIIVAAFRCDAGASFRVMELADHGRLKMLVTPALLLEYEEVLSRPEQRLVHGMRPSELDVLSRGLAFKMEPVEIYFRSQPQLVEADDEMLLEAARNGRAHVIVTHNLRGFAKITERLDIRVFRPSELLKELAG